jgi:choline-sulfatase
MPLLTGASTGWNNETVSQFGRTNLMIKHDDLKYQYYGTGVPEVLFDLKADPKEKVNFVEDARYAEAVAAFRRRCGELGHGPQANPGYKNAGYTIPGKK